MASAPAPLFTALSTSARQLYLLLRCISFAPKVEVQITPEGLRFSAEEARTIQGLAFLENSLFSSYTFNTPADNDDATPCFQISLTALLETLQIFGIADPTSSSSYKHANGGFTATYATTSAFNTPALALSSSGGTCKISYAAPGSPLSITITEGSVTTTCDLTTYEPISVDATDPLDEGIPFDRSDLNLKVIMRSTWLSDAMTELSNTNPEVLLLNASNSAPPYFSLSGLDGPFGESTCEFNPDTKAGTSSARKTPQITETFSVAPPAGSHGRIRQRYRFGLIKKAARAMALASKVSVRCDRQGVLSLQFMIELDGDATKSRDEPNGLPRAVAVNALSGAKFSFVDFRFVPLLDEDGDSTDSATDGDGGRAPGDEM